MLAEQPADSAIFATHALTGTRAGGTPARRQKATPYTPFFIIYLGTASWQSGGEGEKKNFR